ncbi:hypothetical protein [Gluconobacter wancherniae]|uniref:hypothetical protein n=1 Tax=Gluconobacter wancherniae TaxID=1307955 RepID=UPI001B8B1218|nr:hypothetical protein [Gluconobacter wancherniae]MBS1089507.1 hypothetical protein [Gluconobacter wancherniae]
MFAHADARGFRSEWPSWPFETDRLNGENVPSAVYRGSPANVGFWEVITPACVSDMRRLPPVLTAPVEQIGGLGGGSGTSGVG